MFDSAVSMMREPRTRTWRDRARAALLADGWGMVRKLYPDLQETRMDVVRVRAKPDWLTLEAYVGEETMFIKVFDGTTEAAQQAYLREKAILTALHRSRLVPRLLAYLDRKRILVMEHIDGQTFDVTAPREQRAVWAETLGAWLARFDAEAPHRPGGDTWGSYLADQMPDLEHPDIAGSVIALNSVPIRGLVASRNDPSLSNSIISPTRGIVGCDFDNAQMRPRGWDFVQTYGALVESGAEPGGLILDALMKGFSLNNTGAVLVEDLCDVAQAIVKLKALAGLDTLNIAA